MLPAEKQALCKEFEDGMKKQLSSIDDYGNFRGMDKTARGILNLFDFCVTNPFKARFWKSLQMC